MVLTVIILVFTPKVEPTRTSRKGSPEAPGMQLQK